MLDLLEALLTNSFNNDPVLERYSGIKVPFSRTDLEGLIGNQVHYEMASQKAGPLSSPAEVGEYLQE